MMKKRIEIPLSLGDDSGTVVDELINDYIPNHCMGLNDLGVVSGMITAAVTLIATHCQRTGQDYDETLDLGRQIFDIAANVMRDK